MPKETFILKPAIIPVISMALVGTPFLLLGVWVGVDMVRTGDRDIVTVLSGAGVFLFGLWMLLEILTVRIHLTPDALFLRRFWHTRWHVLREAAVLEPALVGDGGFLPGLRVYQAGETRHVGEILNTQFRPIDLERLQRALSVERR